MTLASRHLERMSLEQWRALGEDTSVRSELVEGVLIVSPKPRRAHQRAAGRIFSRLVQSCPPGLEVLGEVDVTIDVRHRATVRAPDIVVAVEGDAELRAADVVLVVEVLSPGSRTTDLVAKRHEYAKAGIANYWIVDLEGTPRLEALTLVDGSYVGEWVTGVHTSDVPFAVTVDLDALR
ncbi:Endonuclease, Uma2 family (restriction endonuclease fold) [Gordonia malaquae]|uniref:Putative restriction endonuclease domain-containing protein n=1 Tax=Gordonia malaquae NBRC 108250 TaxID=1223542 RepID=M3VGY5_GORML|nr:Uma2 family endonuclease [Gordonia malaquae]GAC81359.1 hypothetical protein GM1_032_00600 [Gordonia malaquae NBRC 108250]SEC07773.1 Endonuclease, Uma2 family (restriction endonuclease fold) [Gordonia malaquae]